LKSNGYPLNSNFIDKYVDDPSVFPDVNISQIEFQPVEFLVKKFAEANIPLIIKDITSNIGIPTFNASSIEWITHDYGYLAEGHGAHPDKRIAVMRAITEVSQTRAANIQGAPDDKRAWQFMQSNRTIKFSDITTYSNYDILDDIKLILEHLKQAGLRRAIIVNLTNDRIEIPVVRAIVPGLETFKITKSVMGWRARRYFKN
jgi:ribosomal protein S12 methylthiotransferase accessory factor